MAPPPQLQMNVDGMVSMTNNNSDALNQAYQQHPVLRETQQQPMAQPGLYYPQHQMNPQMSYPQMVPTPSQLDFDKSNISELEQRTLEMVKELENKGETPTPDGLEKLKQDLKSLFDNFSKGAQSQSPQKSQHNGPPAMNPEHANMNHPLLLPSNFQFPMPSSQPPVWEHQRRLSMQSDMGAQMQHPGTPLRRAATSGRLPEHTDVNWRFNPNGISGLNPMTPQSVSYRRQGSRTAQSSPTRQSRRPEFRPMSVHVPGSPMQRGRSHQGALESAANTAPGTPTTLVHADTFDIAELPSSDQTFADFDLSKFDDILAAPSTPVQQVAPRNHLSGVETPNMRISIPSIPPPLANGSACPSPTSPGKLASSQSAYELSSSPVRPVLPSSNSNTSLGVPPSPSKLLLSPSTKMLSELKLEDDMDATLEETGISIEEISQYIEPPSAATSNKWICHFPECGKEFGRKENIKSHVQTHLGDRQYVCNKCNKRFVRGHDMKRHARTHSGNRPYPCKCGQRFARQDALTRHRQRGMCCGAFSGITKVKAKRGRPKKVKPESEDNDNKENKENRPANLKVERDEKPTSGSSGLLGSPLPDIDAFSGNESSPASYEEFNIVSADFRANFDTDAPLFPSSASPPTSPGGYSNSICSKPSPHLSRSISPYSEAASPQKSTLSSIPELSDMSLFNLEMGTEKIQGMQQGLQGMQMPQGMSSGDDIFMPAFQSNETPALAGMGDIDSYFSYNP